MNNRIERVSASLSNLGYEGIVRFDKAEPEYDFLVAVHEDYDDRTHVALLSILATTQDYQLAGDAQRFWQTLKETVYEHGSLGSQMDVKEILADFMDKPVNARLREQKRNRLIRLFENGFGDWFVANYPDVDSVTVWEKIAEGLETTMEKKTVVLAVKVYDIFTLIDTGQYLELPTDVPIPCDLQVKRVAKSSGIVEDDSTESVMDAWADVMENVNEELGRLVSMLRIDSIVWQAGQIISKNRDQHDASKSALEKYFADVGLAQNEREELAHELTYTLE